MTDLMLARPKCAIKFFVISPEDDDLTPRPLQASAKDFGYEIDEQELAEELMAPLPTGLLIPTLPDVDPDDFERIYRWFLA